MNHSIDSQGIRGSQFFKDQKTSTRILIALPVKIHQRLSYLIHLINKFFIHFSGLKGTIDWRNLSRRHKILGKIIGRRKRMGFCIRFEVEYVVEVRIKMMKDEESADLDHTDHH